MIPFLKPKVTATTKVPGIIISGINHQMGFCPRGQNRMSEVDGCPFLSILFARTLDWLGFDKLDLSPPVVLSRGKYMNYFCILDKEKSCQAW